MRLLFTTLFAVSCLALPISAQFNSFTDLVNGGQNNANGSRLGVALRDIDTERAAELKLGSVTGVEVMRVEPGSPAQQAGIKPGDVLLSYNNESIVGAQQLGRLVTETPVGRKIKLEYVRDGKVIAVIVTTAAAHQQIPNMFTFSTDLPAGFPNPGDLLQTAGASPNFRFVWTNTRLGIVYEALDSHESQLADFFGVKHGLLIRSVAKDSPTAKAGLHAGDVITQIADHPVSDPKDITWSTRFDRPQQKPVSLEVIRDHKPITLKLTIPPDQE